MASPDGNSALGKPACVPVQLESSARPLKGLFPPAYRSAAARDLGIILDVNPTVTAWECGSRQIGVGSMRHRADFTVHDVDGTIWLMDAPDRNPKAEEAVLDACARALGLRYRKVDRSEIYDGFRLRNAQDLLRYGSLQVPLGDRVRLLAVLDENGSLTFGECLQIFRETKAVAALASMIPHGFIEVDLDDALIGPETRVTRMRT